MSDKPLSTRDLVDSDEQRGPEKRNPDQSQDHTPPQARTEESSTAEADPRATEDAPTDWDEDDLDGQEPLLPSDQAQRFTLRWEEIQTTFVDEPRESVKEADALVADLMQRLAGSFANERERLESQWDKGDNVSTEDLRVALTRYRSFFERLLSA
jgi:hypothetical protein